jgi:GntR family transcriptional repressor for pyruvate dehydrogenase complex
LTSPFIKIEREESLSHKVERQIRDAISQKIFLPGDKLPGENELAMRFGVSRTAIREAMRLLAGRGLVDIRRGSGIYVSNIDVNHIIDPFYFMLEMKSGDKGFLHLVNVRLFLEPENARLAALHRVEEDLDLLQKCLEEMKNNDDTPSEMIKSDIEFHRTIATATKNPIIPIIIEPVFRLLYKFISSTYRQVHAPDLAIENHTLILQACRAQDGDKAYNIMHKHMTEAREHVRILLKTESSPS